MTITRWSCLLLISSLLWARLDNPYVWMILFVTVGFGLVGFADDYAKVSKGNHKGVSGRIRRLNGESLTTDHLPFCCGTSTTDTPCAALLLRTSSAFSGFPLSRLP